MIVRPRPTLLQLFFITRGSIVPRIAPHIIGFALYSAVIVAVVAPNDLALDALCRVCEISVFEALGEVPPKLLTADHYLYT